MTVSVDYPPLGVNDGAAYLEEYPLLDQDTSRRYAFALNGSVEDKDGDDFFDYPDDGWDTRAGD